MLTERTDFNYEFLKLMNSLYKSLLIAVSKLTNLQSSINTENNYFSLICYKLDYESKNLQNNNKTEK